MLQKGVNQTVESKEAPVRGGGCACDGQAGGGTETPRDEDGGGVNETPAVHTGRYAEDG